MVVGEILTGIALVNSAAKSIKELCSNARDVSSLGSYIDELFEGQKQVNRNKSSASNDVFSVKNMAEETINAKLAQEAMDELRTMVDMRFGFGTWTGIINERARRLQEQKEHQAQLRKERRLAREENMETLKMIGIVLLSSIGAVVAIVIAFKAF